jgi:hypothetical protein
VRRALPHCLALLCGAATALAIGCGADRSNLIPADSAAALKGQLAQIKQDIADGSCDGLSSKIDQVRTDAGRLPPNVDKRLRSRINEGIRALRDTAATECQAAAGQTDTQPTDTQPTDTQPTDTQPTETQTTTTTPDTTTIPPDTTTTPPETTPTTPTPTTTEPTPPADNGGTAGEVPTP